MQLGYQIDWEDALGDIHVPTLVLHRSGDLVIPVRQGRKLADGIPGARYVEQPGTDHLFWAGDQDAVLGEVEDFLRTVGPSAGKEPTTPPALGLTAGGGGIAPGGCRPHEQADRGGAVHQPEDCERACVEHPRQARGGANAPASRPLPSSSG